MHVVYIVASMANACNPSNSQRSSIGRQTSHARVGGTDERELAEYKLGHVNLEGAEKSGEILRIERYGIIKKQMKKGLN